MKRWTRKIGICVVYLTLVSFAAYFDRLLPILMLLSVPWSMLLAPFAFLLIHISDSGDGILKASGDGILKAAMLTGAYLNIMIFLLWNPKKVSADHQTADGESEAVDDEDTATFDDRDTHKRTDD